ncbi:MAG: polysaccharide biosynthesis/export family protein, partial [Bacteroidota bacterium]
MSASRLGRSNNHVLFILTLLVLTSPVDRLAAQSPDYIIGKGDQLLVTVWGFPEFTTSTTVRDDGALSIPLVGDLQAAGLRREEFISNLRKKLADYVQGEIRVTVSVVASTTQRVTVLGAVARPDNYPLLNETGLLEVISTAGGYQSDANINRIKIFHKDKLQPATEIDLEYYMESAEIERMPKVKPGDVVFVPRQQNFMKDFGEYFGYVALFFALVRLT